MRYIIIGSGVAGIAAIEAIRSRDRSSDILLLGSETDGYYSRPGLAYYLTGEVEEKQLFSLSKEHATSLNVRYSQALVERIDRQSRQIVLRKGLSLPFDRLLIATGARSVVLSQPGGNLYGVVKLDHLEDARHILLLAGEASRAVVIGGGITALELVEALATRNIETHLFLRSERYWGNVLDEEESRMVEQRLKDDGVIIHYQTELGEILGQNGRVVGVRTKSGEQIRCSMVAVAVGVQPRKELAENAGLRVDRGILVNEMLQSSDPAIYAAGDVAQVFDPYSQQYIISSLWNSARQQGRAAGLNMSGPPVCYERSLALNVTRLAGMTATIIGRVGSGSDKDLPGIARGDSESFRKAPPDVIVQVQGKTDRLRLMIAGRMLVGAVIIGDQAISYPLEKLIERQVDISPIRARLIQPDAPLNALIAEFYSQCAPNA
jgi:NAD(P)H-nitrite reductase large subunit